MVFECDRKALASALELLCRVARTTKFAPSDPAGVLIKPVNQSAVRLLTTDGVTWLEARMRAKVKQAGAVLLPAKLLAAIVKSGGMDIVSVSSQELDESGLICICSGGCWRVRPPEPREFPLPPRLGKAEFALPLADYVPALRRVMQAVARDETRPSINAVCMERNRARLTLVGTDTYRLAIHTVRIRQGRKARWVIPLPTLQLLLRCVERYGDGGELAFSADERRCSFALGDYRLHAPLREGGYPKWEGLVPTEYERTLRIERESLCAALAGALLIASEDASRVMLGIADGELRMGAEAHAAGRYDAQVPCRLEGPEIEIAFNAEYLLAAVRATNGEQVELELTHPQGPARVHAADDADAYDVLMPMQII